MTLRHWVYVASVWSLLYLLLSYAGLIPGHFQNPLDVEDSAGTWGLNEIAASIFKTHDTSSSLEEVLHNLYKPIKLSIATSEFYDTVEQAAFRIPGKVLWTKPLGKKLCLVDIDNRQFDNTNELFGPTSFDWSRVSQTNGGMLGHYLYAMIHGYDYKFIRTTGFDDRAPHWTKIPALSDILHQYDIVVSIDADAQIHHPEVPFEWLLNRWNVTQTTSLTMAVDPEDTINHDSYGKLSDNAGFIVANNRPRTHEMLKAWASCPDEPSGFYKGCARFKKGWPAEQGAFMNYIRYQFPQTTDLKEIPCDEANGSRLFHLPWWKPWWEPFKHSCKGRFVEHHTLTKHEIKRTIGQGQTKMLVHHARLYLQKHHPSAVSTASLQKVAKSLVDILMNLVYDQFIKDEDTLIIQRTSNNFTLF